MTLTRRPWPTVQDPESLVIATPRTLRHTTPLVSDGRAAVEIVCPRSARGLEAAYSLQQHIQALSGVQVAVVPAGTYPVSFAGERPLDRITPPVAENGGQPARHKILLGNLSTNPDLAALYCAYLCPVDADFPGPGGHYVRTLCDPWGDGANRIVVGASSDDELLPAAEAFAARLVCDGDTVSVPYLHEARISPDFVSAYPEVTFEPDDVYRAEVQERARQAYATRAHRAMTPYISHAAFMYQLTADERFAQLYLDLFQEMVEAVAHWEEDTWGPWGFDADFQSVPMVQGWHAISDAPVFTDEDRCHIASHLVAYLKNNEVHWENHRPKGNTLTRQNHFTFASLGLLYGAQTFGACYHLPDAARWLARADECFAPQLLAAKATEDCESYGWLTFAHTLRYALVRPVPSFFTDGACRALLDRGLANMDNFGYQVSYGDNASYTGSFSELAYWRPAAWVLGDLRYRALIERKEAVRPSHGPWVIESIGYRFDLPPDAGTEQGIQPAKVTVLPIDPAYYQTHGGGPLPIGEGFDKVAFRDSFNPDDPYLLLDGIANGSHGHRDANAMVRFTSQERIWLEDADYDKVAANFHNTLIVTRDGESGVLPPYARLDTIVSAGRVALAESTVLDVGGSDWTRTILWVRALGFVVVDRVVARQAGEFDLRCLWRTVGDAKLVDDQTWRITMVPASLNIVAAPPPTANWSVEEIEEPYVRVTWPTYPYAEPNVRVLRQGVTAPLAAGEECVLVSFLLDGDRPAMVRRDEQGWVHGRVGERDFRLWLGGQSLAVSGAPAGLTARLLYADQDDLVAVGLTGAGAGQFSGAWERSEGALVAAHRASAWSSADEAGWRDTLAALDQALAAQSAEETAPTATAPQAPSGTPATAQGRELWRIEGLARGPVAVADLDNDGSDEVLVGTSDGTLLAYRAGERLWAQRTPAAVTTLGCGDVDGDGLPEIIVGQAEGVVELRDADGTPRWQQEFPPHMGHPA
ncbi:MAG: hypothetical protein ACTHMJ_17280, partial [Thermomicrobiales bacterium]